MRVAIQLAVAAHKDQVDKAGELYILHPMRVMLAMKDDLHKTVAILHDVVEDTSVSLTRIKAEFGKEIADAVEGVTRNSKETYEDFILRCAKNPVSVRVKLADINDNLYNRLPTNEEKSKVEDRRKKYFKARRYLEEIEFNVVRSRQSTQDTE